METPSLVLAQPPPKTRISSPDQAGSWRILPDDPNTVKKTARTLKHIGTCSGAPRAPLVCAETSSGRSLDISHCWVVFDDLLTSLRLR